MVFSVVVVLVPVEVEVPVVVVVVPVVVVVFLVVTVVALVVPRSLAAVSATTGLAGCDAACAVGVFLIRFSTICCHVKSCCLL